MRGNIWKGSPETDILQFDLQVDNLFSSKAAHTIRNHFFIWFVFLSIDENVRVSLENPLHYSLLNLS